MEKETLLKNLGARKREIRNMMGISQKQLAHSIGKDQQSVQRLETGNINPTYYYLYEIADGLEVDLEVLIKRDGADSHG
ncbi:transcriptional regulator with XRE-family HTH domain [Pedobacter cryoconitis]|uniref:Transcriptional regulator with XRE-family HTH domain n=1 Tax=Pedobacter cryoconitis TaxID=188932 RepID=A0A7W8ZJ36_9SPHI|nr:helix-turn-helix transcriptional regulator [Pedobacter cryoconitis]MBB5634981.1 transcriptional regulator with XRE-family HTH domain [Pedobacter cryoconitis]